MVSRVDLIGLGIPPVLAAPLARHVAVATAFGTSVGSANKIQGTTYFTYCNTGTSSFVLPQISGDGGAYIGDEFFVANESSAAIQVYIANTPSGSVSTIYGSAASTAGTTGVTIPVGTIGRFVPVTVSTWAVDSLVNTAFAPTAPNQNNSFNPVVATAFGTSVGSANPIGIQQYLTFCLTGTSSFVLPQLGANSLTAPFLGDEFIVANMSSASIKVYMNNTGAGSAVTIYGGAASTAGTTGVTVPQGDVATFQYITASTLICGIASV